ncbi:MAG: hypothetical protein HQK86_02460 [Nitrospinae bacterium]|nr:hypothetical protein [Nitrospinota bacterium]MBF0633128.1 hypothetical protein [Nitrospinota bacterium]
MLGKYDDAYENTPDSKYDDGQYVAVVTEVQESPGVNGGADKLILHLTFVSGKYHGKVIKKYLTLSDKTMYFVRHDLGILRPDMQKLSELDGRLNTLVGTVIEVDVVTQDNFTNVNIKRRIDLPPDSR